MSLLTRTSYWSAPRTFWASQQEADLSFAEFGSTDFDGGIETDANPIPSRYQDDVTLRKASRNRLDLDEESWHAGRDSNPRPPGSKPSGAF